jgi:UDP-N-acetylmuramyl pentapeptide phosphotransferase/UDP-N-acetylglucosamine-1-phosphate transferase
MLLYFRLADRYNIIDKPNERSSHSEVTIRGGGIIYLVAALVTLYLHHEFWMPVLSLFIIGVISFVDDRITLSSKIRILFHLTAVTVLFNYLEVFVILPWWGIVLLYILVIGIINAYNFMDGINGITGAYSLVVLGGLQYTNLYIEPFVHPDMIWVPIIASLVFLFFNFRKKAKCFAGDVGSVTVALWISFLLFDLMLKSSNYTFILFLTVYGVDAILTIVHRLLLKQNIFEAHRLHFYQILANEKKIPHLIISTCYALLQALIILLVIFSELDFSTLIGITIVPLVLIYVLMKPKLMSQAFAK